MASDKDGTDDFFDQVSNMAERLGLKDNDRDKYVHEHMTRGGYRMVPSYIKDDDEGDKGDDFFGRGRSRGNGGSGSGSGSKRDKSSGGWFPS
jgi:hypothetical protein